MIVTNTTRKTTLTKSAKKATTLTDSLLGLTQYTKPTTMIFKTRFGIHTFGMKYPIDVLILNEENTVVALKQELKPNRIYFWNPTYSQVLELPTETIAKTRTKLFDTLSIESEQ